MLDPNGYAYRDAQLRARQGGPASDKLHFDGYDLGQDRRDRAGTYDDGAYYDDISEQEEEAYLMDQRNPTQYIAARDKEDSLLQTALDRIARARAKGKTNVNLTSEEMDALERRRNQQPEPASTLASPPATPAKPKVKTGSRNNSTASLKAAPKSRKSTGSSFFGSPAKSNSKAKVQRSNSAEQALPYHPGQGPAGVMVPGPNGGMVYAPIYYGPPSPDFTRARPTTSGSRSSSKQSRRESTPPELQALQSRFYATRPASQGSNRSLPDDIDWYPPPPSRTRSASNAQYYGAYDHDMAPQMPAAQGRRNVSGPPAPGHGPDVRYAHLRRAPPSGSPLAQSYGTSQMGSGLRRVETSSSDSSDGQGVQVDIVPDEIGGYHIRQSSPPTPSTPAATTTVTNTPTKNAGNEARKRKVGKK